LPKTVTIVRRGHPLFGVCLQVDALAPRRKDGKLVVILPDGSHCRVPVEWTDAGRALPIGSKEHKEPLKWTIEGLRALLRRTEILATRSATRRQS
jgi:hypothetical protein